MLVEFRVKNFRSLRDEQVFSLVASKDKSLRDTHTQETGIKAVPILLRSAVVYGANASGKSNLIKALKCMRYMVVNSAIGIRPSRLFAMAQPFRLDADSANQPSEFDVTFLLDGVRYQYGFAMTTQRIISEYLLVYKAFKPQSWFTRRVDADTGKDVYSFGAGLKGPKGMWEGATRPNSLFLSMAVQLNSETLRPVFDWFADRLVIPYRNGFSTEVSTQMLKQDEGRKKIINFLSVADTSIADINVETRAYDIQFTEGRARVNGYVETRAYDIQLVANDTGSADKTEMQTEKMERDVLLFHHVAEHGEAVLGLMDESDGTRKLLSLAGPLLDILREGKTLVIDELDTSLHTLLVHELVRLFYRPEVNTGGAQLIFTTHNTSLLDAPNLFRRDQVWFVEKDQDQASALVSLSEFHPRKNEALERGYLMGRYGAVPFFSDTLGLEH
jgi:AAA15 family ATPase/GTPase